MNLSRLLLLYLLICGPGRMGAAPAPSPPVPAAIVDLDSAEAAWVQAHPVIRWGVDPAWPPFSYTGHRGELVGIDAELTQLVALRAGLRIVLVPTASWTETLARAQAGEIDFLSATARTVERMADFDFTDEYASFPVVIITRKDGPFITSIHGLGTARIAAARDHVVSERVRQAFPTADIVLVDTTEQTLLMVSTGQADAAIANLAVASYLLKLRGLANLKIAGVTRYEFPLRFAVRKDAPLLKSILNKGLATVQPRDHDIIYAKYLHPEIAKAWDWGVWRRRALYAILIGAGIATVFLAWNRILTRQIQHCKMVESALRTARDKLEQRTQELDRQVQDVDRLNRELTTANSDLDAFSASVSHDLRAPLRRLGCFASLLQNQTMDRTNPEAQEYWSIINCETKRMDQLINDLLAFARVTRAEIRQLPVNMEHLTKQAVQEFSLETHGREIHWHIGPLPDVIGDPSLLRQVIVNLIENALKFTRRRPCAEIKVDVLPTRPEDHEAVFYVQDNGCGFDMKHAQHLFQPFQRLHTAAEYEGTGIGLANVQRIIQRHGGRAWAEGAIDRGATFWFSLRKSRP